MFEWFAHTRIIQGQGTIARTATELDRHGAQRAVVITDKGVSAAGLVARVTEKLGDKYGGVFDEVPQDTGFEVVDRAYDYARSVGADAVVSIGGGSVIDTAKALCILMREGGKASEHVGIYVLKRRGASHVVIPTTAGTGSEVTAVAVLLDREGGKKVYYLSEHVAPDSAILDPEMTLSLPPGLTASTGMDALTHAIEAATSRLKNPLAAALALGAIKTIRHRLPQCVADGADIKAREAVQVAATMAGLAFASAQVGAVHAIAHSLGAVCGVPHGTANGIMLPPVMRFNAPACTAEMAEIAVAMGVEREGRPNELLAVKAADEVEKLIAETDHPRRLSQVGVNENHIGQCAAIAITDPAISTNPVKVKSVEEVEKLIREAF